MRGARIRICMCAYSRRMRYACMRGRGCGRRVCAQLRAAAASIFGVCCVLGRAGGGQGALMQRDSLIDVSQQERAERISHGMSRCRRCMRRATHWHASQTPNSHLFRLRIRIDPLALLCGKVLHLRARYGRFQSFGLIAMQLARQPQAHMQGAARTCHSRMCAALPGTLLPHTSAACS